MIVCIDAGIVPYEEGLLWQQRLATERRRPHATDRLLLLEHPPVYTMGRRDSSADLLVPVEQIKEHGIEIHKTDRGGRITYHGPGQLVGYLIFKVRDPVPKLVWKIEEILIGTLAHFHLEGERDPKHPGIWVGSKKIAALGLHIERGITTHGFALNVNCDLRPFANIHPCGIRDRGVTSLDREVGWSPSLRDVKNVVLMNFAHVFRTNVSVEGFSSGLPE